MKQRLTHVVSEQWDLRAQGVISIAVNKCLFYRRLISWPINICQNLPASPGQCTHSWTPAGTPIVALFPINGAHPHPPWILWELATACISRTTISPLFSNPFLVIRACLTLPIYLGWQYVLGNPWEYHFKAMLKRHLNNYVDL